VGIYLSTHRLRRGELKQLARLADATPRTLRNWRDREGTSGSPGQPPHSQEARERARSHVHRIWPSLPRGHDGWRSVRAALFRESIVVPTRLVQESVRALKCEARERLQARIKANRVHVEVLAADAIWAVDQTHLCRDERGEVKALAVRECLAGRTLGLSIGPPAQGIDVVHLLEQVADQRGIWPFVIQADNGSENKNAEVAACLERARVIVLWNEPRTPQHNARGERGFGDFKLALGIDKGGRRREHGTTELRKDSMCVRLLDTWEALDAQTPRARLDGLTPVELDRIAPRADDRARRDRFYIEVRESLRRIALAPQNPRARRKAEREAIWSALQSHGLVRRTRGGCLVPTLKGEGIS
jgi:transposase InsO family protein